MMNKEEVVLQKATFGAGCFWGVEAAFREVKGVISTVVGYMGGDLITLHTRMFAPAPPVIAKWWR